VNDILSRLLRAHQRIAHSERRIGDLLSDMNMASIEILGGAPDRAVRRLDGAQSDWASDGTIWDTQTSAGAFNAAVEALESAFLNCIVAENAFQSCRCALLAGRARHLQHAIQTETLDHLILPRDGSNVPEEIRGEVLAALADIGPEPTDLYSAAHKFVAASAAQATAPAATPDDRTRDEAADSLGRYRRQFGPKD
jgi:hypothetical protein